MSKDYPSRVEFETSIRLTKNNNISNEWSRKKLHENNT